MDSRDGRRAARVVSDPTSYPTSDQRLQFIRSRRCFPLCETCVCKINNKNSSPESGCLCLNRANSPGVHSPSHSLLSLSLSSPTTHHFPFHFDKSTPFQPRCNLVSLQLRLSLCQLATDHSLNRPQPSNRT